MKQSHELHYGTDCVLNLGPPCLRQVWEVEAGGEAGMDVFGRSLTAHSSKVRGPGANEACGRGKAGL